MTSACRPSPLLKHNNVSTRSVMVLKKLRAIVQNSDRSQYAAVFEARPESGDIKVCRQGQTWMYAEQARDQQNRLCLSFIRSIVRRAKKGVSQPKYPSVFLEQGEASVEDQIPAYLQSKRESNPCSIYRLSSQEVVEWTEMQDLQIFREVFGCKLFEEAHREGEGGEPRRPRTWPSECWSLPQIP